LPTYGERRPRRAALDGVDLAAVMARVCAARAAVAPHDSAGRLASLGVDVFFGAAAFTRRPAST
jgi:hypothetical protein